MNLLALILKNVRRHPLRSTLTALGTWVLVLVVALIWSVLAFLDEQTAEKSQDFKAIITERWQVPSQMPLSYVAPLSRGGARTPQDEKPLDAMSWQFFVGSMEPGKSTFESLVFAVAMDPRKIRTMMDELDQLPEDQGRELDEGVQKLLKNRSGFLIGRDRLKAMNKKVGENFKAYGLMYRGINLEFEIVGVLPPGRYDTFGIMNADYLNEAIDAYGRKPGNGPHPLTNRRVNLVWLKLRNSEAFSRVAAQVESSPYFANPAVKCETAASLVSASLEPYRTLLWGLRYLLVPAAIGTLSLIIANAISISVRERRKELAVLKVLGFRPPQILLLVLGEALLIGAGAGLTSAGAAIVVFDLILGGVKFPMGFFPSFQIPMAALAWGLGIGAGTALLGSILPAISACRVKVAEVFSKVA